MIEETCGILGIKPTELFERAASRNNYPEKVATRWQGYYNMSGVIHPEVQLFCERAINASVEKRQKTSQ